MAMMNAPMVDVEFMQPHSMKINGETALHIAAGKGHNDEVRALLESSAIVNEKVDNEVMQTRLEHHAAIDIDEKRSDGATALVVAALNGHADVVQTLLEHNAAIDEKANTGATALFAAVRDRHDDVMQTLLQHNASVNATMNDGTTPLHFACYKGSAQSVMTLLAAGANVYARSSNGTTPFELAALRNDDAPKIVTALVALGFDIDAVDRIGDPARQMLARFPIWALDLSETALERARHDIAKVRLDFVRHRALEVCIGLQSRGLDALQTCEILQFACGSLASLIAFHQWWKIATTVKHFHM